MKTLLVIALMMTFAVSAHAQEVKYIDAPKFEGQIFLYDNPAKSDVDFEQWYEIQGRGQFVRNVRVPTLIPYLPDAKDSNGAAIIIAPGGLFFTTHSGAEAMRLLNGSRLRASLRSS